MIKREIEITGKLNTERVQERLFAENETPEDYQGYWVLRK